MLPLWIIDITQKSDRQDAFLRLVDQIDHVSIPSTIIEESSRKEKNQGQYHNEVNEIDTEVKQEYINETSDESPKVFSEEDIENEEKRKAARNARIEGDYWYYNNYRLEEFFTVKEEKEAGTTGEIDTENIGEIASNLYKFQEAIVSDAKTNMMSLRSSNAKPYQPLNVVVLGDASELLTQTVFASIASILQKEKGRFLTGHIHQGINILGMLYIPCNINTYNVIERSKVLRLLTEIEVQHNVSTVRGYDNMMLYQDVQNRTECTYTRLNSEEQAQYLVQCLVHMFLACDLNHPLLNGTGSDDTFYFSMGASSVYFDMTVEDHCDANNVASNIVRAFKEEGAHLATDIDIHLFDQKEYTSDKFVSEFCVERIDLEENKEDKIPGPHPVADFMHRNLKRIYYQYHLRFFPAELLRDTMIKINEATSKELDKISIHCTRQYQSLESALPASINKVVKKVNKNCGGLTFIESKFKDMQEFISKEKNNIQQSIESNYWHKIIENNNSTLEEYHDTYVNDIKTKNSGSGCNALKEEVLGKLKELLSKERTILSVLVRSLLLGIMCVLGLLPIIEGLSHSVIDLGDVKENSFLWATALFILPAIVQFILYLLYKRKQRNLLRILKTYYTHDAYARIANRIEAESVIFYDKILSLIDEYLIRCKRIRNEVNITTPDPNLAVLFPNSMFNQPLNGGTFDREDLIPKKDIEGCKIKVNGKATYVNNLSQEQIFILINNFNEEICKLFGGVSTIDSHSRRFDEELGDSVFISREEIKNKMENEWKEAKETFNTALLCGIKKEMLPRENPTIGEKLIQYKKKTNRSDILEHMIAYAATNGEFSSQSDTEYADVKMNKEGVKELILQYLPIYTTNPQCSEYDEIFKRYIFVTRWRTYKELSLNRLLPKEDFDQDERDILVFADEQKVIEKKKEQERAQRGEKSKKAQNEETKEDIQAEEKEYTRVLSSLILWAICPDDHSNEWLKLFDVEHFNKAYNERREIRKTLNQND